jgi:hypothetical protein
VNTDTDPPPDAARYWQPRIRPTGSGCSTSGRAAPTASPRASAASSSVTTVAGSAPGSARTPATQAPRAGTPSRSVPEACPRGVWRGSQWRACLGRGCPACGPVVRQRNLTHDRGNLAGAPQVTRRLVSRGAWPEARAGIRAAGGRRVA